MRLLRAISTCALAYAAALGTAADARMHHPARGHRIVPVGVAPPLDGLATPSGAYGFRKLLSAYAGSAVRLRRASDNAELDIGFLGCTTFTGCPWNEAAAAAHCAATTCFLRTWYDQSGSARDLVMATAANQPQVIFGCQNGLACLRTTDAAQFVASLASFTPATGLASFSAVAKRVSGTTAQVHLIRQNGSANRLQISNSSGVWSLGGAPTFTVAAAENTWHAAAGNTSVTAGQSVLRVDGTEGSGSTTPTVAAGPVGVIGGIAATTDQVEAIFWDNYALTAPERAVLVGNQRSFWGF